MHGMSIKNKKTIKYKIYLNVPEYKKTKNPFI